MKLPTSDELNAMWLGSGKPCGDWARRLLEDYTALAERDALELAAGIAELRMGCQGAAYAIRALLPATPATEQETATTAPRAAGSAVESALQPAGSQPSSSPPFHRDWCMSQKPIHEDGPCNCGAAATAQPDPDLDPVPLTEADVRRIAGIDLAYLRAAHLNLERRVLALESEQEEIAKVYRRLDKLEADSPSPQLLTDTLAEVVGRLDKLEATPAIHVTQPSGEPWTQEALQRAQLTVPAPAPARESEDYTAEYNRGVARGRETGLAEGRERGIREALQAAARMTTDYGCRAAITALLSTPAAREEG